MMTRIFRVLLCTGMIVVNNAPAEAASIASEEIEMAIIEHLETTYVDIDGIEFTIPRAVQISIPDSANWVLMVSHDRVDMPVRMVPVTVTVADEAGDVLKQFRQIARIKVFTIAAVAAADIARGEPINLADVELRRVEVTGMNDYFVSLESLMGMQSKKIIRPGTILTADTVRPVFLIERGARVNVEVREGAVMIRTEGTARQGGSYGECIPVYIDMTKTTVSGIIVDSDTVLTGPTGG
ncbi:flagellar basal body P-ring formation chaperone FlgA [Candidatus Latescibacterota bacterium]